MKDKGIFFKNITNPIFVKSKHDLQKKHIKDQNVINISSKTSFGIKKLLNIIVFPVQYIMAWLKYVLKMNDVDVLSISFIRFFHY